MRIDNIINRKNYERYFGQFYNMGAVLFSWVFFFLLKGRIVASAKPVIFTPDRAEPDLVTASLIIAAAVADMAGIIIKLRRIRHIKAHPEEYSEFYSPSSSYYETDLIFFHFMAMFCTRLLLGALMGYILFVLLGFKELAGLGSLLFMVKDGMLIFMGPKNIDKPLTGGFPVFLNSLANVLLVFSGFVFLGIGWEAFGQRFNEVLCTVTNWQGLGDFILGIFILALFYFLLFYPTRTAYQFEEIEFTDSQQEERRLLKYYFSSMLFAIIPWLI